MTNNLRNLVAFDETRTDQKLRQMIAAANADSGSEANCEFCKSIEALTGTHNCPVHNAKPTTPFEDDLGAGDS